MKNLRLLYLVFSVTFLLGCNKQKPLFERLLPEKTGITFSNRIVENDTINILNFDYVYNGSGVGVADFNNDGLQDIFFSGNQVSNMLYLNKGNFEFEDISAFSGVDHDKKWCTGIALVDINNDGLMDIYVAATSTNNSNSSDRENILYVHQGIENGKPTFKEMGAEYGVNDNGHSENAAFFDYDNDGDLDLYVLTNMIGKYPNLFTPKKTDGSNPSTDRLYRNDWNKQLGHPVFTNVSAEAGILIEGYGLGLNITDINHDGWKDIYVTNDYVTNDIFYINNQDGTFSDGAEKYFKHTSQSAMGNDIADINNDGFQDIVALDMLPRFNERKKMFINGINLPFYEFSKKEGYTFQYMRNTLQLNNGDNKYFSEVSLMSDIAETDWSWTPSLADFDNDGLRDLLVTNGFPKDVTDRDFMSFRAEIENLMPREHILAQIPAVKISNFAFKNNGDLQFEDVTDKWGLEIPSFSNGAAYADLDNDGDLDYIVNNINDSAFVYQNNASSNKNNFIRFSFEGSQSNLNGIGTTVLAKNQKGEPLFFEMNPYRGYKSTVELFCHFGLGKDTLISDVKIIWPDQKMQNLGTVNANQVINVSYANAKEIYKPTLVINESIFEEDKTTFDFKHRQVNFVDFNVQNLLPFRLSRMGPSLAVADINGDGLDDFYVCGPKYINGQFFLQKADGTFIKNKSIAETDSINKTWEDTGVLFFDPDNDGDQDLYIVTGGNENLADSDSYTDRFYENDGKGNLTYKKDALPIIKSSGSCARAADYDLDGDLDIFVSGRTTPYQYPKNTSSYILRNDSKNGKTLFTNVSKDVLSDLENIGLINDAIWSDFDNDNDPDLILAGEFTELLFFENNNGLFTKLENTGLETYLGMWNSINAADLDHDGDIDYVVGNLGKNTLFKPTSEKPVYFLSGDFDNNSVYDIFPFVYFHENRQSQKLVPYSSKGDVNKMYNPTRSRFKTYKEFAGATMENLLTEDELKAAHKSELNFTESVVILNQGNGKFTMKPLPIKAQQAPLNGLIIEDYNADGNFDILAVGNNYSFEINVGQLDALNGLLMLGDGKGNFQEHKNSGFYVPGDAKALVTLIGKNSKPFVLASQNSEVLKYFKIKPNFTALIPQKGATKFSYDFKGKKQTKEIYWGASYLSQSSRMVLIPEGAKNVKFY